MKNFLKSENSSDRHYDPSIGRFVTKDPIGFGGGLTNLYSYCGNDPMSCIDPSGLWGIQIGYSFSGFLGFGGGSLSGGIAIAGNGLDFGSIQAQPYQSGQFNGGAGLGGGRGVQVSVTPDAQCVGDMGGKSVGGGFDSPFGGFSVFRGSAGNTYTFSGPSLGGSVYGGVNSTNIGLPVTITPTPQPIPFYMR